MYSNKDFTGQDLSNRTDMNGLVIENSCFSQETPDREIFPKDLTGCTFIDCNLDNVFIPEGNKLENCSTRRFKAQDDGKDWIIDEDGKTIKTLN